MRLIRPILVAFFACILSLATAHADNPPAAAAPAKAVAPVTQDDSAYEAERARRAEERAANKKVYDEATALRDQRDALEDERDQLIDKCTLTETPNKADCSKQFQELAVKRKVLIEQIKANRQKIDTIRAAKEKRKASYHRHYHDDGVKPAKSP